MNLSEKFKPANLNESLPYPKKIFHISAWEELAGKKVDDVFTLNPGPQHAEGSGVYFSENDPRFSAAEGVARAGNKIAGVIVLEVESPQAWYISKNFVVKKFNRPRTWHTENKSIKCKVKDMQIRDGIKYLFCDWEFET